MIRSSVIHGFHAHVLALLALLLVFGGCADKAANVDLLLANAKQEREKGNYKSAIIHLKSLLQESPRNAEARYLLGVTYNDTGEFKSAEAELRRALELRYDRANVAIGKSLLMMGEFKKVLDEVPFDSNAGDTVQAEVLALRGLASIGLGRREEGRRMLEEALAKQSEFGDALIGQARLAIIERKPDEASKLADRAIASAPKNVEAWLLKGDLARSKADHPAALAAYRKVIEISQENVPAHLSITQVHVIDNNFDDARKQLAQLSRIAPNTPSTKYLEALLEFRRKNFTSARDAIAQVLKAAPDYLPGVLLAGAIHSALGEHTQAQARFSQFVERAPGYLYARKLLIASLVHSGQLHRALEALQPGLQQGAEDGELMALAGEIYLQSHEFAKAVHFFERAAKLDPKSAAARIGLGMSRFAAGEEERALADLESAVQLDSDAYRADVVLIMSHLRREDYDQALKALQRMEKKQPKNPITYNLKAAIYLGKKNQPEARKHLEHALELSPTYVPAALNLAQLDLQDKKPAAARKRFEAILEKDKNNLEALLALARFAPLIGATPKETIQWLERARTASPGSAQPKVLLARSYAQMGEFKKALEVAQQAQTAHPENAEVLDTLGGLQISVGEKEQALATYGKMVALQPKSAAALTRLAVAQTANGDHTRAISTLQRAVSLQPDLIEAQVALATLELSAGRYAAAAKIAQQIQKLSTKSPVGFILEGDIMIAQNKPSQAVNAYETAIGIRRDSATFIKMLTANMRAGRAEEVDRRLTQWLSESPDDLAVRLYAAERSQRKGDYKSAIYQYEWSLTKSPNNPVLMNNLAWVYHQVKDPRALETAERAYKLRPENPQFADTLGWILVEQGNTKRGIEVLQKAVTAAPKAIEARYHLAQALVKAGDRVKARQELEKVLSDSPGSPFEKEAKQMLEELRR